MATIFASKYSSPYVKFITVLERPLVFRGKRPLRDVRRPKKKKYLKFKTQPNFEFGKAQKGLRLKFEVIWYLKMSITVYVTWC